MRRIYGIASAIAAVLIVAGCNQSGSENQPVSPTTPTTAPGQPARAVAPAADAAIPNSSAAPNATVDGTAEPAETPAAPPADPAVNANAAASVAPSDTAGLAGTKWQVDDLQIEFKDDSTVFVNGGPISLATAGKGANGTYKVDNGQLQINALGQTKAGTWDGESLVIGGTTAEKL